ncbi:MAG: hypothetical protein SVR81_02715 [Chloroflexota bacterium]|nr:hypothetical protein [Chloroflexota bacterium]
MRRFSRLRAGLRSIAMGQHQRRRLRRLAAAKRALAANALAKGPIRVFAILPIV